MKTSKTLRARPNLEDLEERCNPAPLIINGTNANDTVVVSMQFGLIRVDKNGALPTFHAPAIYNSIVFNGFNGNDYFRNDTNLRCTAYGHAGIDTLIGGSNNDYLDGGFGTDYLYGRDGNDVLVGGYDTSYNVLDGGKGNDALYGGYGTDYLYGRDGNDYLFGDRGDDWMYGGNGNDRFDGWLGFDRAWGEAGTDWAIRCEFTNSVP